MKNNCNDCKCTGFRFIPRRPEELGEWWLPRRKGFDVNVWRPSCQCKHTHEEHSAVRPHKCKVCSCYDFISAFCCISCDQKFEDHETIYETEKERQQQGKPIREDFLPLAKNPQVQFETMKQLNLDGRTEEQKFLDEMNQEEKKGEDINI